MAEVTERFIKIKERKLKKAKELKADLLLGRLLTIWLSPYTQHSEIAAGTLNDKRAIIYKFS